MKYMGGWTYRDLLACPAEVVDAIAAEMQAEAELRAAAERRAKRGR